MKDYLQSYHAFLPGRYMRWIIWLVYPVAMLLIFFVGGMFTERTNMMLVLPFVMVSAECIVDMYVFGGFGSKGVAGRMEYVKASVKGTGMVRQALVFDGVRRVLYGAAVAAVGYVDFKLEQHAGIDLLLWIFFFLMSAACFLNSIALWVVRLVDNRMVQLSVLYFIFFLPMIFVSLMWNYIKDWNLDFKVMTIICLLAYVVSALVQGWYMMKKMKEGYYDE